MGFLKLGIKYRRSSFSTSFCYYYRDSLWNAITGCQRGNTHLVSLPNLMLLIIWFSHFLFANDSLIFVEWIQLNFNYWDVYFFGWSSFGIKDKPLYIWISTNGWGVGRVNLFGIKWVMRWIVVDSWIAGKETPK